MKITLRTFEIVSLLIMVMGLFCSLSMLTEIRILGYLLLIGSVYLLHLIGEERKRQRRRLAFLHRMGRILWANT